MTAKVWSFQNQKGGTAKTTTSTNVASCLAEKHKKRVLLIDLDGTQGSSTDWAAARDDSATLIPCVIMGKTLYRDLPRISSGYDFVIIDGVPRVDELTVAAIKAADLVIIPVQPSQYDIWATGDTVQLVKDRQEVTDGKLKAVIMVARAIAGTVIERTAREAMAGFELPILTTQTHQRVAFVGGVGSGLSVMDLPEDDPARQEIEELTAELLKVAE